MCKTEVADSAFADCRRLSDIEYGQWDFSDTEDIYISDAPMRKMRRPFFRIKVILKNEPRLESEIVMEKAKRLYEYIAEHSDLQKEISNILPDDIISNILNGSLPVFPHEDLGIIVDENELIHYMNHAVLYKEVGDSKSCKQNICEQFSCFYSRYKRFQSWLPMHQVTNIYVLSFEYTSCVFLYNTSF